MENKDRQHLLSLNSKDFIIETFRSGGKGGQYQNKTESGVRIKHPPSGAVGESREHRSQKINKKTAFIKMTDTDEFKKWIRIESLRMAKILPTHTQLTKDVDKLISDGLKNGDIRIENF